MTMIFPGMDPYLEEPRSWTGVHTRLVVYVADYLQPRIRPRYVAVVEERVYLQGPNRDISPDTWLRSTKSREPQRPVALIEADVPKVVRVPELESHEAYVNIVDLQSGQEVVTTVEVISPTNKYAGHGRDLYLAKQREVRASHTHLVEIDLLRAGPHVLAVPEDVARSQAPYDYLVCVNRAEGLRDEFDLYPFMLRDRLPRIRVPLANKDLDAVLDLQAVLDQAHEKGCFADRLRYDAPCRPPLSAQDQAWADSLIQAAKGKSNGAD
jgi:hypothetical protein